LKHYIGVYDPESGKMEVMEARKVIVRGVVRAHQATTEDEAAVVSAQNNPNYRFVTDALYRNSETAGTTLDRHSVRRKQRRPLHQSQRTPSIRDPSKASKPEKLTAANLAMLSSIAESASNAPTKEEQAQAMNHAKPRPKGVEGERDPLKIYTVENVVGLDTMKLIPVRQWVESIKAKKEVRTNSRFVAHRMLNHGSNTEKLKVLRYMLLLIDIYNTCRPSRFGRTLPKREDLKKILGDMPEAVLEGVKRKFTNAGTMPKQMADSLIMYLCALAMIIDNTEVNMWDLKEDLKLETKEMALYFTEIGAKIGPLGEAERRKLGLEKAAAAQHKVAKLKGPLSYPRVSGGRPQKMR
jgi:DNA-directed RNA polymerase I subunit RPA49